MRGDTPMIARQPDFQRPTAADLAADADVREMWRQRVARLRVAHDATGAAAARDFRARLASHAPAGDVAAPAPPHTPTTSVPAPAGALVCTGPAPAGDASAALPSFPHLPSAPAPVRPSAASLPGDLARDSSAAQPVDGMGTYPADDGTAWGEHAPARRRLHPLAVLALLLAASWLALMVAAAVAAIESTSNALWGK